MIRWVLQSGPDKSHLVDYRYFDRLKDAKKAASELPPTPNGEERPHLIRRLHYRPVNKLFDKVVREEIVVNKAGVHYSSAK